MSETRTSSERKARWRIGAWSVAIALWLLLLLQALFPPGDAPNKWPVTGSVFMVLVLVGLVLGLLSAVRAQKR